MKNQIYDRNEVLFVENLTLLRKSRCYTQDDLAFYLKINRSRLGAWEEKRACPSIGFMLKISNFFNVDLIDMLTKEIQPPTVSPSQILERKRLKKQAQTYSIY